MTPEFGNLSVTTNEVLKWFPQIIQVVANGDNRAGELYWGMSLLI